ncbi:MAG: IclR family transcriptional regulator [Clostridia bacterium]|nr:IclR family transcriptional regulator [Clostridia bacterium]
MTQKKEGNSGYNAPLIYKAFSLLDAVAANQYEMGISDLSRSLNISKSTIFGITQALTELGALRQDSKTRKFHLGPALVKLGNQAFSGVNLRVVAKPFMNELNQKYQETVFLGTFDEQLASTIIDKADSPAYLKITAPVGTRVPLFAGATSKVFLSSLQEADLEIILKDNKLPQFTEKSITNPTDYIKELQQVRQKGYATDYEEYLGGVNAISVPLKDPWGRVVGAIWMVGFSHSFADEKLEQAISSTLKAAKLISQELGA